MILKNVLIFCRSSFWILSICFTLNAWGGRQISTRAFHTCLPELENDNSTQLAFGTTAPLARAFEMEGRKYSDIAAVYSNIDESAARHILAIRLQNEQTTGVPKVLTDWLATYYDGTSKEFEWSRMATVAQLSLILSKDGFFDQIPLDKRDILFLNEILPYSMLIASTPLPSISVSNDRRLWEVSTLNGITDRRQYIQDRAFVEFTFKKSVQQQHFFHGWPDDDKVRIAMAPRYLEFFDATNWLVFWHEAGKTPEKATENLRRSLRGPFVNRSDLPIALDFIDRNNPSLFESYQNSFKTLYLALRGFKAQLPGQRNAWVPSFELRAGNDDLVFRAFLENTIEARLVSGDYARLRDFRAYWKIGQSPANAVELVAANLRNLRSVLRPTDLKSFIELVQSFDDENFISQITAPLLPWEQRFPDNKLLKHSLKKLQIFYVKQVVLEYKTIVSAGLPRTQVKPLFAKKAGDLLFNFARKSQLELVFQNYISQGL